MKELIQQTYGVPAEKIVINPGGVDLSHFRVHPDRDTLKRQYRWPADRVHLLSVRNLEPRMGMDSLIESIRFLKSQQLKVFLAIVGDGPERTRLAELIRTHKLERDIQMLGHVSETNLPYYYSAADFFVLPTKELEGFGLVTPEAMACGTPVLGTPIGGTREILGRFNASFLFSGTDPASIAEGIRSAAARFPLSAPAYADLRMQCRRFAEDHYSWHRHIQRLIESLASISPGFEDVPFT